MGVKTMEIKGEKVRLLYALLQRMDAFARRLENLVPEEIKATHNFDGERLVALTEVRVLCHEELTRLGRECRAILADSGMPKSMALDAFIDLYGADMKVGLQALRRDLYKRLSGIREQGEESRIRLHAASTVVTGVLRHLGVIEPKQTYGPSEHA